jgi:endonuclease V-like protein UPF0215 family
MRPHVLGIDDGPFVVGASVDTPIVGVMTEGAHPVEAVAVTRFPIDGAAVTAFLAEWITGLRLHPALQAIVLGGVTIAGLAVIDLAALAAATALPVIAVSRRDPSGHRVAEALRAAGLEDRVALLARTPSSFATTTGLHLACAGATPEAAGALVAACLGKAAVPEPLRLAHLVARAVATGESRGRV